MRWTLLVSMDRKVFVAIVDREGHSAASCPKRGKSDQGGKGQGKKGKSSKGPPTMFFLCAANNVFLSAANNVFSLCRQQCFFLSAANNVFSLCRQQCFFSLPPTMFFLSAANNVFFSLLPKCFFPTGSLVQDVGFRVLPNVTEEGLHRCMNFRVAPVHKALVSASNILDSEPGQSGMLHKRTNEWIGLREEKSVHVFDGWVSPAVTAGRKRPESVSLTPFEHNVDFAFVDFPRQENYS